MRRLPALVVLSLLAGCDPSSVAIRVDLERDASVDAPLPRVELDGGPSCEETCRATQPCERAGCEGGTCRVETVADGELCAEDGTRLCVEGACVARGCGDGWREPGDGLHRREGCDDGALEDADLCDASCAPIVGTLARELEVESGEDLAVALEPGGRALLLAVERGEDEAVLWAVRLDRRMREDRPRIVLATIPRHHAVLAPVAAGLVAGGFAIAFVREPEGLVVGVLRSDDDVAPALARFAANGSSASFAEPAIAPVGEGFVVVATDVGGGPGDPLGGIAARRFDADGRPAGGVLAIAEDRSGLESEPSVAAIGGGWRAAWSARDALGARQEVRTRGFAADGTPGPELALGTSSAARFAPHVAAIEDRSVVAWIEVGDAGPEARSLVLDGAERGSELSIGTGGPLYDARAIALAGSAHALACVDGARDATARWIATAGAPPELALLEHAPEGVPEITTDTERVVLAWPVQGERLVRAIVLPRR